MSRPAFRYRMSLVEASSSVLSSRAPGDRLKEGMCKVNGLKIAVFGATGGTGRSVVEQALAQGYEITAFVHGAKELTNGASAVRVVRGDVLNPEDVEEAVAGQNAVISVLGVAGNAREPVVSEGTRNIVNAMKKFGVERLIVQSAHGDAESARELPFPVRFVVRSILLRGPFQDKDRMERIVRESSLRWTIVHPTRLTNGPKTGRYRAGERIPTGASPSISHADVADFLLKQLQSAEYVHKTPTVTDRTA
jgi:putative NADH-flavin reductase